MAHCWDSLTNVPDEFLQFQMTEHCKGNCLAKVQEKTQLRTYKNLRVGLEVAAHVNCLDSKRTRSLISQLRCGVLPIILETGRYHREPLEIRLCQFCDKNVVHVETEEHFVIECPAYDNERAKLLNHVPNLSSVHTSLSKNNV